MGDPIDSAPLPPAGRWFPVIGETLAFLAKPFEFIENRVSVHGPIFRTHLLGKPTVILAGGQTAGIFSDEQITVRARARAPRLRVVSPPCAGTHRRTASEGATRERACGTGSAPKKA